jgi:hypothetical protein
MNPLEQIKNAGFTVELETVDGLNALFIKPFDKLSDKQLAFLKSNKQAIINELLTITVYTPSGGAFSVLARDVEHKAFLLSMNPNPNRI